MVDRAESVKSLDTFIVTAATTKKRIVFEATVSTDDTITLDNLTAIQNALLTKKSNGSNVTFSKATNVITVTEAALTNVPVVGFAIGT